MVANTLGTTEQMSQMNRNSNGNKSLGVSMGNPAHMLTDDLTHL